MEENPLQLHREQQHHQLPSLQQPRDNVSDDDDPSTPSKVALSVNSNELMASVRQMFTNLETVGEDGVENDDGDGTQSGCISASSIELPNARFAKRPFLLKFNNGDEEAEFNFAMLLNTRWRLVVMVCIFMVSVGIQVSTIGEPFRTFFIVSLTVMPPLAIVETVVAIKSYSVAMSRVLPLIHEGVGVAWTLYVYVYWGLANRLRTDACDTQVRYDSDVNHDCGQLYVWAPFFYVTPLFLGQPRFFNTLGPLLIAAVFSMAYLRFHNLSLVGELSLHALLLSILLFVGVFKYIIERLERRRFVAIKELERRLEIVNATNAALHELVQEFTPKHLRNHLDTPTALQIDVTLSGVAVVCQIYDCGRFINSVLPTKAASTIAIFNLRCEHGSSKHNLHHIRTLGDTNFFVSNLFAKDHPTTVEAAFSAVKFATDISAVAPFDVCVGVASGSMAGLPVGTTCIRYDVFGPAVAEAQRLAITCPPTMAKVAPHLIPSLDDRVQVADDEEGLICLGYYDEDDAAEKATEESPPPSPESTVNVVHSHGATMDCATTESKCSVTQFTNPDTKLAFSAHLRRTFLQNFVFSSLFLAALCLITIISAAEERHADMDRPMWVFFALMALSFIGFSGLGLRSLAALRSGHQHEQSHIWLFMILCLTALAGNNFSRPSAVGTSNAHFIWVVSFSVLFIGASIHQMLGFQIALLLVYYPSIFFFRPLVERGMFHVFIGIMVFANVAIQQNRLQVSLFINLLKNEEALEEQKELRAVRQAIQRSLIPPVMMARYKAEKHLQGSVKTWSCSNTVVVTIIFHQDTDLVVRLVDNPEALREYAESVTRLVEDIVPQLTNKTLSIVKVFGGVMTLAGPLLTETDGIVSGVEDAFEFIEKLQLLSSDEKPITLAVAAEQVVNVLRLTEFPSYELMGPGVNTSRAMANACPAPMSVVTEKLTQLYQRECKPSPLLRIGDGESWRLRDMGVQRVCHVTCQGVCDSSNGPSTTSADSSGSRRAASSVSVKFVA